MKTEVKMISARWPKAMSELMHSNQFLKISAFVAYGLCLVLTCLAVLLATKSPEIIAVARDGVPYSKVELPKPEVEIIAAALRYIELRYRWEPSSIQKNLRLAEAFILPQSRRAFSASMANIVRFSSEKMVSQNVYADRERARVNLEKRTVWLTGDRFTAIQGIRAAGELKLELTYESGPRSEDNPWGVYFVKEREE